VEKSKAIDFSETVEVKVLDKEDNCVDSYFFAYFHDLDLAVNQIRRSVQGAKARPNSSIQDTVKDTTSNIHTIPSNPHPSLPDSSASPSTSTLSAVRDKLTAPVDKLNSLLRPAVSSATPFSSRPTSVLSTDRTPYSSPVAMTPKYQPAPDHTYPPSLVHHSASQASDISGKSTWSVPVGVPSWLKNPSKRFFTSSPDVTSVSSSSRTDVDNIREATHHTSDPVDFGFSMVDGIDSNALDPLTVDKFRAAFAFDEKEALLAGEGISSSTRSPTLTQAFIEIPGYLFRVLPVFGRINISSNYFCFRSSQPLTKTRVSSGDCARDHYTESL